MTDDEFLSLLVFRARKGPANRETSMAAAKELLDKIFEALISEELTEDAISLLVLDRQELLEIVIPKGVARRWVSSKWQ